ncbi:MAG: GNAT family N-acetyltransferase [Gemmatimonadota bacterium]
MPTTSILSGRHLASMRAFLETHIDVSSLMLSNLLSAGVVDHGLPFQATYAGSIDGDRVVAVAAHCWNGSLLLQAPVHLGEVVHLATESSGRSVTGIQGPWSQVVDARDALGLTNTPAPTSNRDVLYSLELEAWSVPPLRPGLALMSPESLPEPVLIEWRVAFLREALAFPESPELRARATREMQQTLAAGRLRVLAEHGRPVAMLAFIGRLPNLVHIGGVWVPPAERGHSYGRALFTLALESERREGISRAVLSADPANTPACRLYEGLGFRAVGDYGIVVFASAA